MAKQGILDGLKRKLGYQILMALFLVVAVFGVLMFFYIGYYSRSHFRSAKSLYKIHGDMLVGGFSQDIVFGVCSGDTAALSQNFDDLFKDPTVSYAVIYDNERKSLLSRRSARMVQDQESFPTPPDTFPDDGVAARDTMSPSGARYIEMVSDVKAVLGGGATCGWIRVGFSLDDLVAQRDTSRRLGAAMTLLVVVLGAGIVVFTLRKILPPILKLAVAARKIGEGEYDVEVRVEREDEIGILAGAFNEMAVSIKEQRRRSEEMIDNISETIMMLTETAEQLVAVATEQSAGATEQAVIVEEVVATTEEISSTANRIADTAASVNEAVQKAYEAANQGRDMMEDAVGGINLIKEKIEKGTAQILDLAWQAQMIGGVVGIIEEISDQTNLLSLNATIEAAGAGEYGKRFTVVAEEVQHLAKRTLEATESIKAMVEAIQKSSTTMVSLADQEQVAAEEGAGSVMAMGEYFQHILDTVDTSRRASSEIGIITRQQSSATNQMVASMREVEQEAREVENGAKKIETSMESLKQAAGKLMALLETQMEDRYGEHGEEERQGGEGQARVLEDEEFSRESF